MRSMKNIDQFIGRKFYNWTIIQDIGVLNGKRMVKAACDCGRESYVGIYAIINNISKSCGCNIKSKEADYLNKSFGRLTVTKTVGIVNFRTIVSARCECGHLREYKLNSLLSGNTKSCGCLNIEKRLLSNKKHGASTHPLMQVWNSMLGRCYDKNGKSYPNYGGRGVEVCDEWRESFSSFYNWARDKWKRGLQLDKDKLSPIKPSMLYCPEYCCFITRKENNRNRSNNILLTCNGDTKTIAEWAEIKDISYATLRGRVARKWDDEKVLTTPIRLTKKRVA